MRDQMKNLFVDDNYNFIYCDTPKVASTNWKRVMFALKTNKSKQDLMSISGNMVQRTKEITRLISFPRTEMKEKLRHYTKFLFVRDPFVRLISAYRNKIEQPKEYYYQNFAKVIRQQYGNQRNPPKTVNKAVASGVHPSFYNFIQYLVDPQTKKKGPFDPHWRPMYQLCHPCLVRYDFVGHQETLQEDAEQLLKMLNVEDIEFPPSRKSVTSSDSVLDWFRTVPLQDRRKLYKLYEADFKLFGYRRPSELLDG